MTLKELIIAIGDLPAWVFLLALCSPAILFAALLAARIVFWIIGEIGFAAFDLGRRNGSGRS